MKGKTVRGTIMGHREAKVMREEKFGVGKGDKVKKRYIWCGT